MHGVSNRNCCGTAATTPPIGKTTLGWRKTPYPPTDLTLGRRSCPHTAPSRVADAVSTMEVVRAEAAAKYMRAKLEASRASIDASTEAWRQWDLILMTLLPYGGMRMLSRVQRAIKRYLRTHSTATGTAVVQWSNARGRYVEFDAATVVADATRCEDMVPVSVDGWDAGVYRSIILRAQRRLLHSGEQWEQQLEFQRAFASDREVLLRRVRSGFFQTSGEQQKKITSAITSHETPWDIVWRYAETFRP